MVGCLIVLLVCSLIGWLVNWLNIRSLVVSLVGSLVACFVDYSFVRFLVGSLVGSLFCFSPRLIRLVVTRSAC